MHTQSAPKKQIPRPLLSDGHKVSKIMVMQRYSITFSWSQLVQSGTQEVSQLAAGDSILMPLNAASCIASDSAACDGDTWHMATLRLFIDVQRLSNAPIVSGGVVVLLP